MILHFKPLELCYGTFNPVKSDRCCSAPKPSACPHRTETSACSTLKTRCSRRSQEKQWGIKALNLSILSSSTNALTTRRASLSPWQERGASRFLQSGFRRSRSNKLMSRDLHQKKRSEDVSNTRVMAELNFYKSFHWNDGMRYLSQTCHCAFRN